MQVLIVESDAVLADRWFDELSTAGCDVHVASSAQQAIRVMDACKVAVIVLDLELAAGGALSVPIYAGYRLPDARIIVLERVAVIAIQDSLEVSTVIPCP